ncbi:MAG: glycosyl transferase [Eggerthellaceae bacterium]|nr:glycosyl transferase [Eggerthellaceae bacterium]
MWVDLPKFSFGDKRRRGSDYKAYPFTEAEIDADLRKCPFTTHDIEYAPEVAEQLTDLSRVFRYSKGTYAIGASLIPTMDASDYFTVRLIVDYYVQKRTPKSRKLTPRQIERKLFNAYYKVARTFLKPKRNTVLFLKENGEAPTENMAAIRDRMLERGLDVDFPIMERYRNTFTERQNLGSWLKDINAIARSRYVFIDDYCPAFNFINADSDTTLTQVWHAGVGFKSVGYARFGITGSPDPFQCAHRRYDYALVGNAQLRDIYSEVFGIGEEALLATGMPRLDHFLDEERQLQAEQSLYGKYPWMKSGRVIVFAPTFRGSGQASAYYPYDEYLDYQAIWEMCERTDSYFIIEMHHFIKEAPKIPKEYASRIKDLSSEALSELLYVADVLITDYSSCFYDALLLKKPVIFYVPDKVEYSVTRGVQHSVDDMAPGVVCDTSQQLMEVLESGSYTAVEPHASMIDRCAEGTGFAADRVIDAVLLERDVPGVRISPDAS